MEENENLDLNTDSIKDRTGVRSSLTDINGIPVFTDVFEEQMESAKQEKQSEEQNLSAEMFVQEISWKQDTEITGHLFINEISELVIRNDMEIKSNREFPAAAGMIIMAALFLVSVFHFLFRKGRKNDINDQHEAPAGK